MSHRDVDPIIRDVFGAPLRWRAQAALALGLGGEELLGGVSPAAGCPGSLAAVLDHVTRDGLPETIVDIGAGVGGIGEWFRRRTDATVTAVEPLSDARLAAQYLFGSLDVRSGSADATGLEGGTADAVVMCGVLSLIDDQDAVLAEAHRIARPGATVAIVDLFSADGGVIDSEPNVFRDVDHVADALERHGCTVQDIVRSDHILEPAWASAARRVDHWIHRNCHDHPSYPAWSADKRHLREHLESKVVTACCIVARAA